MKQPVNKHTIVFRKKFDEEIRNGILELLILQALFEQDRKWHELHREIGVRTDGVFCRTNSLHHMLLRLLLRGFISSNFRQRRDAQTRIIYHIEESGKEYLAYGKIHLECVMEGLSLFFQKEENLAIKAGETASQITEP